MTPEQQKWVSKLLGYDYEIIYRSGKTNSVADALSRRPNQPTHFQSEEDSPTSGELHAISSPHFHLWADLKQANQTDPYLVDMRQKLLSQPERHPHLQDRKGLLLYKGKILVPPSSALRPALLQEFHNSKVGGHSGVFRTYRRLAQSFFWEAMKQDVKQHVAACDDCQRNKSEARSPAGLMQPLPIPSQVWEDVSLDFVDGLPSSIGKTALMVVVDRFTKYAHFVALTHPYTARKVAALFVTNIVRLHGVPKSMVSDRDLVFFE